MDQKIIIQNIIFPSVETCFDSSLYFRAKSKKAYEFSVLGKKGYITIKKNETLKFDTYMNSIEVEKLMKYTNITNIHLSLKLTGKINLFFCYKEVYNDEIIDKTVLACTLKSDGESEVNLELPIVKKQLCYIKIVPLSNSAMLKGGKFYTKIEVDKINDVKMALTICTYKREAFIQKNCDILNNSVFSDPNYLDKIKLNIIDNAEYLDKNKYENDKIKIIPNINSGGAGGFTRGMIEAIKDRGNTSHILLMDDDVVISPESLKRTINILRLIKDEFKDSTIGGSMLRLDFQTKLIESGAIWNAGLIESLKKGIDLSKSKEVLRNSIDEHIEYNAWWYCCMPLSYINDKNLPLPIFIRGDDVEYGLRNKKKVLTFNGICVWHEPFENKYSSWVNYYITRNECIVNSVHYPKHSWTHVLKLLFRRITRDVVYYRYKDAYLVMKGMYDYLKGIDFLLNSDAESLHKSLMADGYKMVNIDDTKCQFNQEELYNTINENEHSFRRIIRMMTMNGYLLKCRKTFSIERGRNEYINKIVPLTMPKVINFYRIKKVFFYDKASKKGFYVIRQNKEMILIYLKFLELCFKYMIRHKKVIKEYRQRVEEVTNLVFWEKYLKIGDRTNG